MELVYANSGLNLATSDSPDGDTGCFFHRPTSKMLGWKVPSSEDEISSDADVWDCTPYNWAWDRFDNNPLGQRAWVYQERFLSPRTLYFGAQELAWERRTERATETFPAGFASGYPTTPGSVVSAFWNKKDQADLFQKWLHIVNSYSVGKLTVSTDKLVAISGIACLFASRFGSTYLEDMCKEDLMLQLPWFIYHKDRNLERREIVARAPTWSWASTDSQVWTSSTITYGAREILATVSEVVVNAYPNPFVDFNEGFVRIKTCMFSRGYIIELQEMELKTKFAIKLPGESPTKGLVYLDYQDHNINEAAFYLPILIAKQEAM